MDLTSACEHICQMIQPTDATCPPTLISLAEGSGGVLPTWTGFLILKQKIGRVHSSYEIQHQGEEQCWAKNLALPHHSASGCSRERAAVPLVPLILHAKSSRRRWSDPALLTLHQHGYGAATWWEHWKRSLKSAPTVSQQVFTSSQLTSVTCCTNTHTPLRTKSNKQTFGSNLSLCDIALRYFKSNYMAGNCLSSGRWQQRAGSSKTCQSHLFSYDNNQGVNYNRLWNRIAIRFNNRWVIVPKSWQYWNVHLNDFNSMWSDWAPAWSLQCRFRYKCRNQGHPWAIAPVGRNIAPLPFWSCPVGDPQLFWPCESWVPPTASQGRQFDLDVKKGLLNLKAGKK